MTRTDIKHIYHDFDLTKLKFIVKFKNDMCEFSESRYVLWDTTLVNCEHILHMKKFVLVPYLTTTVVSINILFT